MRALIFTSLMFATMVGCSNESETIVTDETNGSTVPAIDPPPAAPDLSGTPDDDGSDSTQATPSDDDDDSVGASMPEEKAPVELEFPASPPTPDAAAGTAEPADDSATDSKQVAAKIEFTDLSLQEIAKLVNDKKAVLIDVRSQQEWDETHVEGAEFIPSSIVKDTSKATQVTKVLSAIDKDIPVFVHCFRGGRAMACAKILAQNGHDIRPIQAKFEDFADAGFNVKNEEKE